MTENVLATASPRISRGSASEGAASRIFGGVILFGFFSMAVLFTNIPMASMLTEGDDCAVYGLRISKVMVYLFRATRVSATTKERLFLSAFQSALELRAVPLEELK